MVHFITFLVCFELRKGRTRYLGTADLFVCFSGACLEEHSRRKKVAIVAERGHDFVAQFRVRTLHTNNQVNPGQRSTPFLVAFEKVRRFSVLWERPLWWASLYSRALTTICVDEKSRPPVPALSKKIKAV